MARATKKPAAKKARPSAAERDYQTYIARNTERLIGALGYSREKARYVAEMGLELRVWKGLPLSDRELGVCYEMSRQTSPHLLSVQTPQMWARALMYMTPFTRREQNCLQTVYRPTGFLGNIAGVDWWAMIAWRHCRVVHS